MTGIELLAISMFALGLGTLFLCRWIMFHEPKKQKVGDVE